MTAIESAGGHSMLVLALRAWQLKHNGELPDNLQSLVPDDLAALPKDPYSNEPFGYERFNGQPVFTLTTVLSEQPKAQDSREGALPPGSRVLYSVGPDGRDDHGVASAISARSGDIIFVLPAIESKAAAEKEKKATETTKDKPAPASPK